MVYLSITRSRERIDQFLPGVVDLLADFPPFSQGAAVQQTRDTGNRGANALGVKHPDNIPDFRPDSISPQLRLLSLMVEVSQSNRPAQLREARVDDGFRYTESRVDGLE